MKTFAAFVLPDMGGSVVVHDRYQNYDAIPGLIHQLCAQHILRDLAGAAETYPGAHWPVQITQHADLGSAASLRAASSCGPRPESSGPSGCRACAED